jgi:hypothetical protein
MQVLLITTHRILSHVCEFLVLFAGGASTYLGTTLVKPDPIVAASARTGLKKMLAAGRRLTVATWNIAAINNNPFEYWITYKENPEYEKLMMNVEHFLDNPGDKDVKVSQVFTEDMFSKLDARLTKVGWRSVRSYWENDFRDRQIVSGFMKVCGSILSTCFSVSGWRRSTFLLLPLIRIHCWEANA